MPIQMSPGRTHAVHRRLVVLGGVDHALRHDALVDDPALRVDVGDEGVERAHALGEAGLDRRPLVRADHARDGVDHERLVADGGVEADALARDLLVDRARQRLEVAPGERAQGGGVRGARAAVLVDGLVVAARLETVVRQQVQRLLGDAHAS